MSAIEFPAAAPAAKLKRPRLGFLGVGWIGLNRMKAIIEADTADIAAIVDPSPDMAAAARRIVPDTDTAQTLNQMLDLGVDGIVIATPSALHAEQCIRALEGGAAVFCQKPLGRNLKEVRRVVDVARAANRLLAVDLSYRFTEGMRRIRDLVQAGELGQIYAVEAAFHNAYGPDKDWFYDCSLSGGGCVMDLGIHLVDLALWVLGFPDVEHVRGTLFAKGNRLDPGTDRVEDYGLATLDLATGASVQLSCSWRLPAGCDAVISAAFYGTEGGAALRNVDGSFYDFVAERYRGTAREVLAEPPDAWGGRAAVDWARRLSAGEGFSNDAERLVDIAGVIDRIYGR